MRFCQPHWDALREAIRVRGLYHLVASGGEAIVKRMQSSAQEGSTLANCEPLMGAHNAILGRMLSIGGSAVMMPNDDGSPRCPLCYANQQHAAHCADADCTFTYDSWINEVADYMLGEYNRLSGKPAV